MQDKYITVTQLTRYIKFKLDNDENLMQVFLKGEISNFKAHTRGHYYFTIKDEFSRINAIMFATNVKKLKFLPQDGMKVILTGRISVYEASGTYQIYVNDMIEDGIGNLYVAYEQLKAKLEKEGLFDPSHKKRIPKFPEKIGIITAPTGAAIRDILSTIQRRWPIAETLLFPSLVQGAAAAPSVVRQIEQAQAYDLDVLIVGRGGGSIEDLWCFNDENVARAIYHSRIPVISAVGHEIDFTIADFVADLRAPTPTGAAEMAVPNQDDFYQFLLQLKLRLSKRVHAKIEMEKERLERFKESYVLKNPLAIYEIKEQRFDALFERGVRIIKTLLTNARNRLSTLEQAYIFQNPEKIYEAKQVAFQNILTKYQHVSHTFYNAKERDFQVLLSKCDALNPLLTMKRGYTITRQNDHVIHSLQEVDHNKILTIEFQDGTIDTKVVNSSNGLDHKTK